MHIVAGFGIDAAAVIKAIFVCKYTFTYRLVETLTAGWQDKIPARNKSVESESAGGRQ